MCNPFSLAFVYFWRSLIGKFILGVIQKIIPPMSNMTNSAFQSGGVLLNILSALAIHLLKCVAKAE